MRYIYFLILVFTSMQLFGQNERYLNKTFSSAITHDNEVYGTAKQLSPPYLLETSTTSINLLMDIYQPVGDTQMLRPAILFIHGGAFLTGSNENEDMVAFCDSFARMGYLTATIKYRLGMNINNAASGTRAVYRGVQDGRAAIRFLKENAVNLKIDTNNIYMVGSSAGAFIVLHNLYMNQNSERPSETYSNNIPPMDDLGCLDCSGNNYIHGGQANAVVAFWGAIQETSLIKNTDDQDILLIHGTNDQIVKFNTGSPFNYPTLPATYGSNPISEKLNNLNISHETWFVENKGHEFYGVTNGNFSPSPNQYWDTANYKITAFLYNRHKPISSFSFSYFDSSTIDFSNQSVKASSFLWDFGDGNTSTIENPSHSYSIGGKYLIKLITYSKVGSSDTTSKSITITLSSVDEKLLNSPIDIYPNPIVSGNTLVIQANYFLNGQVEIYNVQGKCVLRQKLIQSSIQTSHILPGIYILKISKNRIYSYKKLIVH